MGKFGIGGSLKKKMASMKADKEALVAKQAASMEDTLPETPEVPDVDEMKDAVEDSAEEMVEGAKEAGESAAFNAAWKMKLLMMKNLVVTKLSCCTGGAEESKSSLI